MGGLAEGCVALTAEFRERVENEHSLRRMFDGNFEEGREMLE